MRLLFNFHVFRMQNDFRNRLWLRVFTNDYHETPVFEFQMTQEKHIESFLKSELLLGHHE